MAPILDELRTVTLLRQVDGAYGIAVHRGIGVRRDIERCNNRPGKHPSQRLPQRQRFGCRYRFYRGEDACPCLRHAEQAGIQFLFTAWAGRDFLVVHIRSPKQAAAPGVRPSRQ